MAENQLKLQQQLKLQEGNLSCGNLSCKNQLELAQLKLAQLKLLQLKLPIPSLSCGNLSCLEGNLSWGCAVPDGIPADRDGMGDVRDRRAPRATGTIPTPPTGGV